MFANWSKESTTSSGTGTLALSAVSGFPRFADNFSDGQPCDYAILDSTGAPVECGIGHYVASNQLARDYVEGKYVGSTLSKVGATAANLGTDNTNSPWTVIATPLAQAIAPTIPAINAISSSRILVPFPYAATANTHSLTANTPHCIIAMIDVGHEIFGLGIEVTTLASGNRIQVGIYPVKADGSIGPLFGRTGDLSPSSTGIKTAQWSGGANLFVPPGWYLFAICSDVNPTLRANGAGSISALPRVTPLGCTGSTPYGFCSASALTSGWTALSSSIGTLSGATAITADFPVVPFVVLP